MNNFTLSIEPLGEHHDRRLFLCGNEHLDRYLQQQANQDIKRNLSRTYVLVQAHKPSEIIGYYSISTTSMNITNLPEGLIKKLPRYPVLPAMLLGRLAVSREIQGHGLGEKLLLNALERCYQISKNIGSLAVIVDAKNENAVKFYKNYGFIPFMDKTDVLFLPMKTITQLFAETIHKSTKKLTIA